MSYVLTVPEMLTSAAADLTKIGAGVHTTYAAAAGPTIGVVAPAADGVSAAMAATLNTRGQECQAVLKQATEFYSKFTQTLAAAGNTYAETETANAATMSNTLNPVNIPNTPSTVNAPTAPLLRQTAGLLVGDSGTGGGAGVAQRPITALILGGTGNPRPSAEFVRAINERYIQPRYPGAVARAVQAPQLLRGFKGSVAQGVTALTNEVNAELALGNKVVVFGHSQGATIVNGYTNSLIAAGAPHVNDLSFITLASPNTPNGGLFSRHTGLHFPFLDVPFNSTVPQNNPYTTHMYASQYDIVSHAPRYPLNIFSTLNAMMGAAFVHPALSATADQVANAMLLPTSPGYLGNTQFYMISNNLPLLEPLRYIPYLGNPLADLIQPSLRVLVDLGYGSYGAGLNYADIFTPASLLSIPHLPTVASSLATGMLQGPYGVALKLAAQAGLVSLDSLPNAYPWIPSLSPELNLHFGQPQVTELSRLNGHLGNMLRSVPLAA